MSNINILDEVMAFAEASEKWGLGESTLRSTIKTDKLQEGVDYRKSGKVWIITKEAMLRVYGNPVPTLYKDAERNCIVVLQSEWDALQWEDTGIKLHSTYNKKYMSTVHDVATELGYNVFAKMNTLDYCYEKNEELFILRGPGSVIVTKLPKSLEDVRENDGVICNGCYTSITSYDELPQ